MIFFKYRKQSIHSIDDKFVLRTPTTVIIKIELHPRSSSVGTDDSRFTPPLLEKKRKREKNTLLLDEKIGMPVHDLDGGRVVRVLEATLRKGEGEGEGRGTTKQGEKRRGAISAARATLASLSFLRRFTCRFPPTRSIDSPYAATTTTTSVVAFFPCFLPIHVCRSRHAIFLQSPIIARARS